MKLLFCYLFCMYVCISHVYADEEKKVIPPAAPAAESKDAEAADPAEDAPVSEPDEM